MLRTYFVSIICPENVFKFLKFFVLTKNFPVLRPAFSFHRPDAFPAAQPTTNWRQHFLLSSKFVKFSHTDPTKNW